MHCIKQWWSKQYTKVTPKSAAQNTYIKFSRYLNSPLNQLILRVYSIRPFRFVFPPIAYKYARPKFKRFILLFYRPVPQLFKNGSNWEPKNATWRWCEPTCFFFNVIYSQTWLIRPWLIQLFLLDQISWPYIQYLLRYDFLSSDFLGSYRRKAMHVSTPCMCTGVLKNQVTVA